MTNEQKRKLVDLFPFLFESTNEYLILKRVSFHLAWQFLKSMNTFIFTIVFFSSFVPHRSSVAARRLLITKLERDDSVSETVRYFPRLCKRK
jgi:hypothetical protein